MDPEGIQTSATAPDLFSRSAPWFRAACLSPVTACRATSTLPGGCPLAAALFVQIFPMIAAAPPGTPGRTLVEMHRRTVGG